eukprot:2305404-Pyramimonas_sp.AAC.1
MPPPLARLGRRGWSAPPKPELARKYARATPKGPTDRVTSGTSSKAELLSSALGQSSTNLTRSRTGSRTMRSCKFRDRGGGFRDRGGGFRDRG